MAVGECSFSLTTEMEFQDGIKLSFFFVPWERRECISVD